MELIHLRPADYVTTSWSGGETTQLTIAPDGAVYADRDFLWRVSSATVSVEESDFTPLPDYHRLISVLKGDMTLTHGGGETVTLHPGDVHAFEGGDDTHSWGRCTDFNLMLRRGHAEGAMEAVSLAAAERRTIDLPHDADELLLYCAEGTIAADCKGRRLAMKMGDSLLIRGPEGAVLTLTAPCPARLMLCRMRRI